MREELIVRKATISDLAGLLQCEQGVISAERPFDPTLKDDPVTYYDLPKMLADPQTEVIVIEKGNAIIASGYARIEPAKSYAKHTHHAYLGMMYVHPDQRGKGLNALIIERLKQCVKDRGITELRLEVYADNYPAIKAYEKVGFTNYIMQMRMGL